MELLLTFFMTFIIYSFIGWLWETVYCSIKAKRFVYRGFLMGPYCPVYGFGVILVLLLIPKNETSLLALYFSIVVIVTVVEFIASFLLEKIFKLTLWDYKEVPFNIEGRVAVPVSIFWGVGCIFLIKVIDPIVTDFVSFLLTDYSGLFAYIVLLLFISDVISTISFSLKDKGIITQALKDNPSNQAIKEQRYKNLFRHSEHPSSQAIKEFIAEMKERRLHIKHLERLIKNYPNIDFIKKMKKKD